MKVIPNSTVNVNHAQMVNILTSKYALLLILNNLIIAHTVNL